MSSVLSRLLLCLAVLAVGTAQVFGIRAGYLCGCTGQVSAQASCEADECHPASAPCDGCDSTMAEAACEAPGHPSPASESPDHQHSEIREDLVVTGVPPVLALPAVVLVDLPPSFHVPAPPTLSGLVPGNARPAPVANASPPMPLLVAWTVVRLV